MMVASLLAVTATAACWEDEDEAAGVETGAAEVPAEAAPETAGGPDPDDAPALDDTAEPSDVAIEDTLDDGEEPTAEAAIAESSGAVAELTQTIESEAAESRAEAKELVEELAQSARNGSADGLATGAAEAEAGMGEDVEEIPQTDAPPPAADPDAPAGATAAESDLTTNAAEAEAGMADSGAPNPAPGPTADDPAPSLPALAAEAEQEAGVSAADLPLSTLLTPEYFDYDLAIAAIQDSDLDSARQTILIQSVNAAGDDPQALRRMLEELREALNLAPLDEG
jgi:TolA-binding protein